MKAIPLALLAVGCATRSPDLRDRFPPDIAPMCERAMSAARADIESCGTPLAKRQGCEVVKVAGIERIDGAWAFASLSDGGRLVYGEYNGWIIRIGCDPVSGGEVSERMLYHEMGHYWLVTNRQEWGHDAKYDRAFGWSWIDGYLKGGKK